MGLVHRPENYPWLQIWNKLCMDDKGIITYIVCYLVLCEAALIIFYGPPLSWNYVRREKKVAMSPFSYFSSDMQIHFT